MKETIHQHEPQEYIIELAKALKEIKEFKTPDWAEFVKTGPAKVRPPQDNNFWYIRTASILRQLYIRGVVGVNRLRTRYGSKKDRGGRPDKFKRSGGKIIRTILQQAEQAGFVERLSKIQFGRRLTQNGRNFLDSIKTEKPMPTYTSENVIIKNKEINKIPENTEDGKTTQ